MTSKIGPSEMFREEVEDIQTREEIFQEGIPLSEDGVVYYYGSEGELELDQSGDEAMESQKPQ